MMETRLPNLGLTEKLLYSTTRLNIMKNGTLTSRGTGFYYTLKISDDILIPLVMTNKHVLAGGDRAAAITHWMDTQNDGPSGEFFKWGINYTPDGIFNHPSEDLCALPLAEIHEQAMATGRQAFMPGLNREMIPTEDLWNSFEARAPVIMVGCPNGLFDEANNLPIIRSGYTASALSKQYQGQPHFLVDMACFPGSSGSPVFLLSEGTHYDSVQNVTVIGGGKFYFIGVLFAGPTVTNAGNIVMSTSFKIETSTMMHLGQVIRSSAVLELEEIIRSTIGAGGS